MRADRLVSLVLLLQARGRMTAQNLARELQVSPPSVRGRLLATAQGILDRYGGLAGPAGPGAGAGPGSTGTSTSTGDRDGDGEGSWSPSPRAW